MAKFGRGDLKRYVFEPYDILQVERAGQWLDYSTLRTKAEAMQAVTITDGRGSLNSDTADYRIVRNPGCEVVYLRGNVGWDGYWHHLKTDKRFCGSSVSTRYASKENGVTCPACAGAQPSWNGHPTKSKPIQMGAIVAGEAAGDEFGLPEVEPVVALPEGLRPDIGGCIDAPETDATELRRYVSKLNLFGLPSSFKFQGNALSQLIDYLEDYEVSVRANAASTARRA